MRFSRSGASVTLVLLTGGERGNPSGTPDQHLKAIRRQEAEQAARILGISRLIVADFHDGRLQEERDRLSAYLAQRSEEIEPDLVITHDPAGLYGHPDHIACSEVVTGLHQAQFPKTRLWHVALPSYQLFLMRLVGQVKETDALAARRVAPTHGVFVGAQIFGKLQAVRAHRSQRSALGKGLGRLVPAWLIVGLQPVEYFTEVPS